MKRGKPRHVARKATGLQVERLEGRSLLSGILVAGTGPGRAPTVEVFDALTGEEAFEFRAYSKDYRGGVRVAVGDVDGDGAQDIVTAPGPGLRGVVKVFRGTDGSQIGEFLAAPGWYR